MATTEGLWQSVLQELSKNKTRFSPVRGTQIAINNMPYVDGNIYFAIDTKMIWLDAYVTDSITSEKILTRLLMGNGAGGSAGNVGFLYANADFSAGSLEQENADEAIYILYQKAFSSDLSDNIPPDVDTLIINSNGWFFRVQNYEFGDYGTNGSYRVIAELISSGAGGGSGGSQAENIHFKMVSFPTNLINGKDATVNFIPYAAKDRNGTELDETVTVTWTLAYTETGTSYTQYATGILSGLPSGEEYAFNFGTRAKYSSKSKLTLVISELNSVNTSTWEGEFITSDLTLQLPTNFSNNSVFGTDTMTLTCQQSGNMDKILEFYWDDELIESRLLDNNSDTEQSVSVVDKVGTITHGYHTVRIELSQWIEDKKGFGVDPLEFEVATRDPSSEIPIIWLGSYQSTYYNYDTIQIPFRVYVASGNAIVHLYKEGKELEGSPREITDTSSFSIFEIVDADLNMLNTYTITNEQDANNIIIRNIEFTVEEDPLRKDFGIQKSGYLTLNFDASGRSNSESATKRASWSYEDYTGVKKSATFQDFNWYNNGWITDENNKTCLRISNGARFSIPIGDMVFAGQGDREQSHTFELQFKIRNVQDYSNLIHNITRYKDDTAYFNEFYDTATGTYKTTYTNYDAFLANYFKTHNIPFTDITSGESRFMEYDDLEFDRVEKQINLNAIACGFFTGDNQSVVGLCVGPQDAFFSNGTNTVSVNYVEDNIINLSAVYSNTSKLIYIYINGVLTGVIKNSLSGSFSITSADSTEKALEFNSLYCDIDLYKIRFYRTDLNVNDIVTNFAVDLKDVSIYDQNKLAVENSTVQEYQFNYKNMIDYNAAHLDSPIMPYIIFDTTNSNNGDKLSYSKSVKVNIGVEFVNTPLELAYTSGELETLAGPTGDKLWKNGDSQEEKDAAVKKYYQHHCPSWIGENVSMAVQGTSSEFYPRRNYKLKTKGSDGINIHLNRGPFESDYELDPENTRQSYWYMDNYTAGTTKFTMKIDYMESSGTYNMGFANLIKNAYSKHPLDDLNNTGALTTDQTVYEEATSYEADTIYWYKNHKGNWKNSQDDEVLITSEADFNLGPIARAAELGTTKVLSDTTSAEYNKWYTATTQYVNYTIDNTDEYRTSVQGFRTLAFHKKSDGSYTYIGMYNMMLDKGSDEVYGFKPEKTTGDNVFQKFLNNKKISKIAECWEFENNSRTFCSFKDPMNRKDLSFNVYTIDGTGNKIPTLNSMRSAPVVVDSFEYRYHTDADILDYVMNPDKDGDKLESDDTIAYMEKENVRLDFNKDNITENYEARERFVLDRYKNWEKAVAWVWSTNTDSVNSGGSYIEKEGLGNPWKANTYYILVQGEDDNPDQYVLDTASEYNTAINYYTKSTENGVDQYNPAYLGAIPYEKETYYVKQGNDYVLSIDEYNPELTYFEFTSLSDEQMAARESEYDRLVVQCKEDEEFDSSIVYYTYDGEKPAKQAVSKVDITADDFNSNKTGYYKGTIITYGSRSYTYDTKEYRIDKFINELGDHFDIEYLSTYFVMTEVFECYDSRGKNAMFASWGPQKAGGEYIWYPIFYDIDTQLGINNTGIPSFEYNVDATEDGNYSTSDSILWNNFYKYFKSSRIIMKYKHLKGLTAGVTWAKLTNPPLSSVANIEGWYLTDPTVCKSIVMRGKRPLIATNLDEYYKYITITNSKSYEDGTTGHISSDTSGSWTYDANGTYFYALQGDRSLSRQQFLTNRLEYIDSWLNQGNYSRGGNNRMWGRVAANNPINTSDLWIETDDPATSYYVDETIKQKRHLFDAEYWLTLTPTHSTYVTLGDDNEAYPSVKYNGIDPVRFEISSIEDGVRESKNYPEQLLYVYGMNQMADVGDMSNMYWQEFKIEGEAKHLTRLLLGYDGIIRDYDENGNSTDLQWYNKKLNPPTIPASSEASGMPLLKEVNFSNIQISSQSPTLDLTSCEKLQNFRATGSNLTEVKFAEGVALNTLYLPASITRLELVEARLLTNLLTTYTTPTRDSDTGELTAVPGLWIDGLFTGTGSTAIQSLKLLGGSLGYDSYKLLKQYYDVRGGASANTIAYIDMTDVNWSPYELVEEGEEYSGQELDYYLVDNHYGFMTFTYSEGDWKTQIANHEIYKKNNAISNETISQISNISMFETFINNSNYRSAKTTIPNITGVIYVQNSDAIDESYIRNTIQPRFPNLTFFFENVIKRPSARFIYFEEDNVTYNYVTEAPLSIQTLESTTTDSWFNNPLMTYNGLDKLRNHYDFFGWAIQDDTASGDNVYTMGEHKYRVVIADNYGFWVRPEGELDLDYTFYAVFVLHQYKRTYLNADGTTIKDADGSSALINYQTFAVSYGVNLPTDSNGKGVIPSLPLEDIEENFYYVNQFKGWAFTKQPTVVQDFTKLATGQDYEFIAVYDKISVYDNILDPKYLNFNEYSGTLKLNYDNYFLEGKITLPTEINGIPVVKIADFGIPTKVVNKITHIFWAKDNRALTTIGASCFYNNTSLVYFEQPETCTTIEGQAFANCTVLGNANPAHLTEIFNPIQEITGPNILQGISYGLPNKTKLILPGHSYTQIANNAFSGLTSILELDIGSEDDPCTWFDMVDAGILTTTNQKSDKGFSSIGANISGLSHLHIYISQADNTNENKEKLLNALAVYESQSSNDLITNEKMGSNDINAKYAWIVVDPKE